MTVLYNDKYIKIFEDRIKFKAWVLPWGKKEVKIDHIKKLTLQQLNNLEMHYNKHLKKGSKIKKP